MTSRLNRTLSSVSLTGRPRDGIMKALPARNLALFYAFPRARPLWSLSVEDLKQWRRLCLAMLAGRIPAWFPRCADCSDEYVTWKPS